MMYSGDDFYGDDITSGQFSSWVDLIEDRETYADDEFMPEDEDYTCDGCGGHVTFSCKCDDSPNMIIAEVIHVDGTIVDQLSNYDIHDSSQGIYFRNCIKRAITDLNVSHKDSESLTVSYPRGDDLWIRVYRKPQFVESKIVSPDFIP